MLLLYQHLTVPATPVENEDDNSKSVSKLSHSFPDESTQESIIVVSTVDGGLAGLSKTNGQILWQQAANRDRNDSEYSILNPWVSTTTTTHTKNPKTAAVPSIHTGKVYLTRSQGKFEESVSASIRDLVDRAPFVDAHGRVYTGYRETSAVLVELGSGEIQPETTESPSADSLWMGRVDYTVSIRDAQHVTEFTYAELRSLHDMVLGGESNPEDGDDSVLIVTPSGHIGYRQSSSLVWLNNAFAIPVAHAMDASTGKSVSIQLVPDATLPLDDVSYIGQEMERQLSVVRNNEETIVGALPDTGELYAMPLSSSDMGAISSSEKPNKRANRCSPGSPQFPRCLKHQTEVKSMAEYHFEDGAITAHERLDALFLRPRRSSYRRLLQVLSHWLPPLLALLLVSSFELGRRRKRDEWKTAAKHVIQVYEDTVLGHGGGGTVVYKGKLDGRLVAVKRMLKTYHASADREISLLIESDGHPNVVRYFLKELRGDFVYLALELCDLSLHDLIGHLRNRLEQSSDSESLQRIFQSSKLILSQIIQGVIHLHRLRIVHRDLKPANVGSPALTTACIIHQLTKQHSDIVGQHLKEKAKHGFHLRYL